MTAVYHSSKSDEWATPWDLFYRLNSVYRFTLDAAANSENALCSRYYTKQENGLIQSWANEIVWCNPPYSSLKDWLKKCSAERHHATIVALVPSRTDTRAWHDFVIPTAAEIYYIRGRLKFGESKNSAPFPSALIVWRPTLLEIMSRVTG